ncbi:hypothetical protein [Taibaiella sp. KBW10]|uniref:hypothetical protein n=1 Tax=Taibaiella sp. KBW10 TaxID=2153357 RepID=UPI001F389027|nr:hypothetical protein [Taibaiella sp. KBW10]
MLGLFTLVLSCSKNKGPDGDTGSFNVSDFEVSNIIKEVNSSTNVHVSYDFKNISSRNYSSINGGTSFRIEWTVRTTDGNSFQQNDLLPLELNAGATSAEVTNIAISAGKTPDLSTVTYRVYKD